MSVEPPPPSPTKVCLGRCDRMGGFESIAPAVERVTGEQAARLKRFVETGVADEAR